MLRQFTFRGALVAGLVGAALAFAGCGIKGPLRPAPKATATPPPPPAENPARAPATTSPALPPPSSSGSDQRQ
jgi:multidrug efflux pump subunit AcrA (membrane-fusion protein)